MTIRYTDHAALVPDDVTQDDLAGALATALDFGPPAPWIVGDLLVALRNRAGEDAMLAALPADDVKRSNFARRCLAVCDRFPPAARRDALEFGHHRRVLRLDADGSDAALDEAEENAWTPAQLGLFLSGHDPDEPGPADMWEQLAALVGSREVTLKSDGYGGWRLVSPVSSPGSLSIGGAIKAAWRQRFGATNKPHEEAA